MAILRIQLFGKFQISRNGAPVAGLDAARLRELLAYLLVHRNRTLARENLAGLFWGEYSKERARKYLRQSLWQLSTILESKESKHQWLWVEPEWVQFRSDQGLWLDVDEFESVLQQSAVSKRQRDGNASPTVQENGSLGEELPLWQKLREAADLYRGEFLPGCYQDWCIFERERLQDLYLKLLDELMDACEASEEFELGLEYGMRVLRYDKARERTHRRLMRLYFLSGDRTGALRQYQRCLMALTEELDIEPTQLTRTLVEQIRSGTVHPEPRIYLSAASSPDPKKLAEVLVHLNSLRQVFQTLQKQVTQDIHVVEQLLQEKTGE